MEKDNKQEVYFNTITRAIRFDKDTFVWFINAISSPLINKDFNEDLRTELKKMNTLRFFRVIVVLVFYLICYMFLVQRNLQYAIIAALLVATYLLSTQKIKSITADVGTTLVKKEYPTLDLQEQTLYQICEEISVKRNTLSLVDLINIREKIFIFSWITAAAIAFSLRNPSIDLINRTLLILVLGGSISYVVQLLKINCCFRKKVVSNS